MSTELTVIPSSALTEQEQAELNASIDSIIAAHKNNRQEINRLVFESVSAMTDSEGYEQQLSSRRGLRRLWGAITGSNKRLQDKINSSRAAAQFAAQTTLQRLSEQNLLTFDLITAVNNKLNASMTAVEGEINQIYAALIQFFKQNRSDMIQLENRVAKLEQNVNLINWQNSIEYQMLDGVEYVDLDDASKIVCMVRDFYDITSGEWRTSDLLLLKTVMSTIDISPRGNIRYYDFIVRVAGDKKLLTKLLGGKHIQRLPETYLVPLLGIKKLELLDTDEAYIVDTVENSLQSAGVVADRHKLENNLVQNYVAQEAQVNLDTEVNNYDLTMEMLFNLRFAEDSGLFQEEVAPEVQEVEPAEQAEEGKAAEEEFLKANFGESVPQLEDLSEKGYARANAMLFWAYYFGYEDYPSDLQKALEYAKKGSDAADPICGLLYAAYSDISQAEKLEQFRKLRPQVRKMADTKDDLAILAFGACYFHDQQYEDAQKYLDQYEKAGGVLAYEMLGLMQQYIQKNGKAALTYYEKAAKNKFYHAYILIGDMYLKGCTNIADLFKNRSSAIEQDKSKAREYYKKAAEHNQAEGAHKMVETTAGTVERAYWTNMAEKQGYKKGMKSWTSDIEEFVIMGLNQRGGQANDSRYLKNDPCIGTLSSLSFRQAHQQTGSRRAVPCECPLHPERY